MRVRILNTAAFLFFKLFQQLVNFETHGMQVLFMQICTRLAAAQEVIMNISIGAPDIKLLSVPKFTAPAVTMPDSCRSSSLFWL